MDEILREQRRAITAGMLKRRLRSCKFSFVSVKLACNLHTTAPGLAKYRDISSDNCDRKTGCHQ